ncbi:uncharacterized protein LOC114264538 isoform X6 [Camellia sinensis]|uniref:uncharacterized protein LOC114264538 isoform X6 n=1 Tax=Camellia sinensis TaxID=4442 RepID=UPI0010364CBD|nr:uncharacterized protein LOC114264538 isoform X6 [Camellia sinensis]
MRSREREREKERRRRREHEEKTEGRVALRSDSHFFARAVLRSYLLRSFVRLRFSARSMKTHERSKRSRLSYLSLAPPNFSPKLFNTVDHVILPNGNGLKDVDLEKAPTSECAYVLLAERLERGGG